MSTPLHTSGHGATFRSLVLRVTAIPAIARSEMVRLALSGEEQPDLTTSQIVRAIRKDLETLLSVHNLPEPTSVVDELDDTRNEVEVAFAIDSIIQELLTSD